ncbi:MAG: hypothetical protein ABIO94_10600 [Opitutaceae bacterium]
MPSKRPKKPRRLTPQIKISIPKGYRKDLAEAMEFDGATKPAVYALSALMQRVRNHLEQKAALQRPRARPIAQSDTPPKE